MSLLEVTLAWVAIVLFVTAGIYLFIRAFEIDPPEED